MNLRHYIVGVGMYGQSRWDKLVRAVRLRIMKAKEDDVDKKIVAVSTIIIFFAQTLAALMFLTGMVKKPFRKKY